MSYYLQGLGNPVWPEGCDQEGQARPQGCVPTEWIEATPRFITSVRCSSLERPHGVRTQLPPGGESEEYRRFVAGWISRHDCVQGEVPREYCCRTGQEVQIPWTALGIIGGIAAGFSVWYLLHRRKIAWETLEEEALAFEEA
jgi:hypothetical protein